MTEENVTTATTIVTVEDCVDNDTTVADDGKLTLRHLLLAVEIVILSLSASYTEMCVVPALPVMTEEWGEEDPSVIAFIPWVLSAFNIVGTIATSILGYLASIYGPKYPTIASFMLYALGQIGCALSNNVYRLVIFRAVQGVGMAMYTLFDSVVSVAFPKKYVPLMVGVISTENPIGTIVGLLGGSALLDVFSRWQNMFWITLPFTFVLGIAFFFCFKDSDSKKGSIMNNGTKRPPFDWLGPIFFTVGLVLFLSSFTLSDSRGFDWLVITSFFVGIAFLVVFYFYERKVEYPLIPVRLFKGDMLVLMITSAILGMSMVGLNQILPYMLLSPESTVIREKKMINVGAVMIPLGVTELFISPVAGVLGEKIGFTLCIFIGTTMQAVALTLLTFFHYTLAEVLICLIIYGSSFSLIFVSLVNVIMTLVPVHEFAILCGAGLLVNLLGGSIGPIITDFISRKYLYSDPSESSSGGGTSPFCSDKGYTYAILFTAVAAIVAFILTLFLGNKFSVCEKKKKRSNEEKEVCNERENEADVADETTKLIN